jgi:hypothetical protein
MRVFTDKELYPIAQECEKTGKHIPQELIDSMSQKGILHMRIGPGKHLHGVNLMNGAVSLSSRCRYQHPSQTIRKQSGHTDSLLVERRGV